jgi:hypothetical protein
VNWEALHQYDSSRNSRHYCSLHEKSIIGGVHLIRLLSFGNIQWVARVQHEPSTLETAGLPRSEIDAMEIIFNLELDDANTVGAAFILTEILPGSSAMDAGGYEVHGDETTPKRVFFCEQIASTQV